METTARAAASDRLNLHPRIAATNTYMSGPFTCARNMYKKTMGRQRLAAEGGKATVVLISSSSSSSTVGGEWKKKKKKERKKSAGEFKKLVSVWVGSLTGRGVGGIDHVIRQYSVLGRMM